MPRVTLVMVPEPGLPQDAGAPAPRYELDLRLDAQGLPDAEAWRRGTAPWPARGEWPGRPPVEGDVQYDPDTGWALRFFPAEAQAPDAPLHELVQLPSSMRPGELVRIREPSGVEHAWRIVSVT